MGGAVRATPRNEPVFVTKKGTAARGKSRTCGTKRASSADKGCCCLSEAGTVGEKNIDGGYARATERKMKRKERGRERVGKKVYRFRERMSEWWGRSTRETHANARPRVRELRRGRCNTVPIVQANRAELTVERKGKDRYGGSLAILFTWRGDNSACIYAPGNDS